VGGDDGYGRGSESSNAATNNTTALAAVTSARDTAVSTVFYGTLGTAADGADRLTFENVNAATYAGDVEARFGEVTRADAFSSMSIVGGTGNDTFIFDAFSTVGNPNTNAGFTSADTVAGGTGTDTLVIDGNTALVPGIPRIDHQTSEWDNVTGIDVLRFGNNNGVTNVGNAAVVGFAAGGYYAAIDNDFIRQTDAGNRLTIVNNNGDRTRNTQSDLVLDLRGLSQNLWITFIGANGDGSAGNSSNRLVLDDTSANQNMRLNGGDLNTTALGYSGNNDVLEIRNNANVSAADLTNVSNFGRMEFVNDSAIAQSLSLTLTNAVVAQMVDSSWTATRAAPEVLFVQSYGNAATTSGASMIIDARAVSGFNAINVTGDAVTAANDTVQLNSNVDGTASVLNLGAGTSDR